MRTFASSLTKVCFVAGIASSAFASDVVLQKVPPTTVEQARADSENAARHQSTTFGLINYDLNQVRTKARALYVSSGTDLKQANQMIDDQTITSFGFSVDDASPTTVIDLGKVCTLRRLSAIYSARPGSVDFYVLQSVPGTATVDPAAGPEKAAQTIKLESGAFANLKRVGSAVDDGKQGRASVEFPATTGRYVMVRWLPASHADTSFTVAEVSAYGPQRDGNLLVSSGNFSANRTITADSKDIGDAKDMGDNKDIPAEGPPAPPAEGPPPTLPQPPPFTFIPQLVPVSE